MLRSVKSTTVVTPPDLSLLIIVGACSWATWGLPAGRTGARVVPELDRHRRRLVLREGALPEVFVDAGLTVLENHAELALGALQGVVAGPTCRLPSQPLPDQFGGSDRVGPVVDVRRVAVRLLRIHRLVGTGGADRDRLALRDRGAERLRTRQVQHRERLILGGRDRIGPLRGLVGAAASEVGELDVAAVVLERVHRRRVGVVDRVPDAARLIAREVHGQLSETHVARALRCLVRGKTRVHDDVDRRRGDAGHGRSAVLGPRLPGTDARRCGVVPHLHRLRLGVAVRTRDRGGGSDAGRRVRTTSRRGAHDAGTADHAGEQHEGCSRGDCTPSAAAAVGHQPLLTLATTRGPHDGSSPLQ